MNCTGISSKSVGTDFKTWRKPCSIPAEFNNVLQKDLELCNG